MLSVTTFSGTSITDANHISNLNPFRYRGYFYDSETGFYYCNSRYYDPQMRRFINADGYVSTGQGYTSYNMFAYCLNNPVMYYDIDGLFPWAATLKIGGSVALTALTSVGVAIVLSNPILGVAAAASIICAAADGGVSAYIAGGDVSNGILAGTVGGVVSTVITSIGPGTTGIEVGARFFSSATYDITYTWLETQTVTKDDVTNMVVDATMDAMISAYSYGNASNIDDKPTKALYYGVADGIVDITQTGILTDTSQTSNSPNDTQTPATTPIYNNCRSGSGITTRYNCIM